jgi:hypothetical protein
LKEIVRVVRYGVADTDEDGSEWREACSKALSI